MAWSTGTRCSFSTNRSCSSMMSFVRARGEGLTCAPPRLRILTLVTNFSMSERMLLPDESSAPQFIQPCLRYHTRTSTYLAQLARGVLD